MIICGRSGSTSDPATSATIAISSRSGCRGRHHHDRNKARCSRESRSRKLPLSRRDDRHRRDDSSHPRYPVNSHVRALTGGLLAVATGPYLAAQDCPDPPTIHPSVTHGSLDWAGVYRAPWEFVCGRPLVVRVRREGEVLTATVEAPGCAQHGEVRWTGGIAPGARGFAVRSRRWSGGTASWREGTGMLTDRCTIEFDTGGTGRMRFTRVDPACPGGTGAIVVFVGGLLDDWNRNLLKVFCAYDAEGEGTRKLYFAHNDDVESMRDRIAQARRERPAP